MATATIVDPDRQFQVNQITRILEKNGASEVKIWRNSPHYPQGYIIGFRVGEMLREVSGEHLTSLVETIVNRLKEEAAQSPTKYIKGD